MRKIFALMFPVNFSGNIYHKASTFICLPFLLLCFVLSAWSNLNGVQHAFGSLPDYGVKFLKAFALVLDPINWLCFTLALVSIQAFRIAERLQKTDEIPDGLSKALKPTLVIASGFFIVLTAGLTYGTFLLSHKGGHQGASAYISEMYAPESSLDSLIMLHKQAVSSDIAAIKAAYKQRISTLRSEIGVQKSDTIKYQNWYKYKRGDSRRWSRFDKYNKAKSTLTVLNKKLDGIYKERENKEVDTKETNKKLLAAQTSKHKQQKAKHDSLQAEASVIMDYATVSWTLIGLFIQLISFVLTADKYKTSAYGFMSQSISAYIRQQESIQRELIHISMKKQQAEGATSIDISKPSEKKADAQAVEKHKEAQVHLPEPDKQKPIEIQPVNEPKQATQEPEQAPEKAESSTFTGSDKFIADQILRNHSSEWLQRWKPALVNSELLVAPIKSIQAKYDCSRSQVDSLRRQKKSLLSFTRDEKHLKSILEKI